MMIRQRSQGGASVHPRAWSVDAQVEIDRCLIQLISGIPSTMTSRWPCSRSGSFEMSSNALSIYRHS